MYDIPGIAPKYETPEEMRDRAVEYFEMCDSEEKVYTVAGLTRHLGFAATQSLFDYAKKELFTSTIKGMKLIIEEQLESMLLTNKGNVTGTIFNLKNNYRWTDRHDIDFNDKTDYSEQLKRIKEVTDKVKEKVNE